ncbi:uncharacterized protein OCT59_025562 [Rhizophagus irregularis]|uniref:uncharacterized protein n=1 Tax=Rhizophagus irregularis TaxID=588596 RepID=UPI00331EAC29|nr:hypothetical protein OCT59_025562 [Rhizophagus irregularis]
MKHIILTIILFLIFFKTFAIKSSVNCDDFYFDPEGIKFLANHQVELTINGPHKVESPGGTTIYTVLSDFTWENGYNMGNILDANNCLSKSWGETIGLEVTVYAHCFNQCETICLKSCTITAGISYDPPPPPK